MANNEGIYLYCILPKKEGIEIKSKGMDGNNLYTFEYKDIVAVISDSEYKVYELSTENIMIHENVVTEMMDYSDVLPFNFGNVMKSKSDLSAFLKKTYISIRKNLIKVSGKFEVGLKIFIKSEFINEEIENEEIRRMKKRIQSIDNEADYELKIELGKMVKKSLEVKQREMEEKIFKQLKKFSSFSKSNECNTVNMVLNTSYLIEKNNLDLFTQKLNEATPPYDEKYIIKFTGPWPPYNFIELED